MRRIVFGPFTLDLDNGDLTTAKGPVKLDAQPTKLLTLLVERAGTTVTREEIESALWDEDIVVDFEGSIRACIRKIRNALGDSATKPRFVETQTGRGYRFVGDVSVVGPRAPKPTIVGRDVPSAELERAYQAARAGAGGLYVVSGEAGIGKTALVESFLEGAAGAGRTVLRGWCSERLEGAEAYLPFLDALAGLIKRRNGDGAALVDSLRTLAPTWHAQLDLGAHDVASEASSQKRMHREIAAFFEACSQQAPLIVFLDDVHWADAATFDLITYLAGKARDSKLLMLLTLRTKEHEPPWFAGKLLDMKSRHLCTEIELSHLRPSDVADYLAKKFASHAFPERFAELVHAQTAGSPLFMVELLRFLSEQDTLVRRGDVWSLSGSMEDVHTALPDTLASLIARKLGQLEPQQKKLLVAASVQGLEFDASVIARALELDLAVVEEELQTLDDSLGLVRLVDEIELPDGTPTRVYRFVHTHYQNALYDELVPARRVQLSRLIANVVRECFGARVAEVAADLALLYEEAREHELAAEYFLMAARKASDVFAYTECARLVRSALALMDKLPQPDRSEVELELLQLLMSSLTATHGFGADELTDVLVRTQELLEAAGDVDRLHAAMFGLFSYKGFRGDLHGAGAVCQELWESAQRAGGRHRFMGYWARGISFFLAGQLQSSCAYYERALGAYEPAIHRPVSEVYAIDAGVGAFAYASWASWYAGFPERASKEVGRAVADASNAGPLSRVIANGFATHLDQLEGNVSSCAERAKASALLADELDLHPFAAWAWLYYAWALVHQGRIDEGLEQLGEQLARYESTGSVLMKTTHLALVADACRLAERPEAGLEALSRAFEVAARGERFHVAELHRLRGELKRMMGADDEADASYSEALALARAPHARARALELRAAVSRARLLVARGRHREAREELDKDDFFLDDRDTFDRRAAKALVAELG